MRLAALLALTLAAALVAGCGGASGDQTGSGGSREPAAGTLTAPAGASAHACPLDLGRAERLRATHVSCGEAQRVATAMLKASSCSGTGSRFGCSVRGYRCLATASGRGWSVSCARLGRSVAFTIRRG